LRTSANILRTCPQIFLFLKFHSDILNVFKNTFTLLPHKVRIWMSANLPSSFLLLIKIKKWSKVNSNKSVNIRQASIYILFLCRLQINEYIFLLSQTEEAAINLPFTILSINRRAKKRAMWIYLLTTFCILIALFKLIFDHFLIFIKGERKRR